MELTKFLGSAREAALDGLVFEVEPHRIDESRDDVDAWKWKVITCEILPEGQKRIVRADIF